MIRIRARCESPVMTASNAGSTGVMGTNTELIQQAYEAFGRGDVAAVLAMLHDDVEWNSPRTLPHGGEFHGLAEVGNFFAGLDAAWDPLTLEVQQVDEVGGLVVGVVRASGMRRGGEQAGYGAAHVFRVGGGKIRSFHEYVDADGPIN